jgi:hypothetical protein
MFRADRLAARNIANLASKAHALARRDFPAETELADNLSRAACRALIVARRGDSAERVKKGRLTALKSVSPIPG